MKIKEIMNTSLILLSPTDTIKDALKMLIQYSIGGAPVVSNNKLMGIVTERDILRYLDVEYRKQGWYMIPTPFDIIDLPRIQTLSYEKITEVYKALENIKVETIMQRRVYTISPEDTLEDAIQLLMKAKVNRLPVLDEKNVLVGIVTRNDILKALASKEKP